LDCVGTEMPFLFSSSLIFLQSRTLYELGLPWANARQSNIFSKVEPFPNRKKRTSSSGSAIGSTGKNKNKLADEFDDFLKTKIGTIVQ
jgi:hypothetical protein